MNTFNISPAEPGGNQVASGQMPNYLQIQFNGVNLGGPDATVLNFVGTGFALTRGSGATADVVTLTIS